MNKRTITVKGKGNVRERPDLVVVTLNIESKDYEYQRAMDLSTTSIKSLADRVESLGFDRQDLKTTSFDIETDYESYKDQHDNYQRRFIGYSVSQRLILSFDFTSEKLGEVLKGIAESSVNPTLSIGFSVKDKELLEEKLLIDAAKSATRRAEILTKAAGSKLGQLLSIDYDWSELHVYSEVNVRSNMLLESSALPEIEPEEIEVGDTVRFVWEIE